MDISLSDFDLVVSFCDVYNLDAHDGGNTDYQAWAGSIRYIFSIMDKKEQRDYIKEIKWSRSSTHTRPILFERLMSRICLGKSASNLSYSDICEIQRKVKSKHGLSHCHNECYDFNMFYALAYC